MEQSYKNIRNFAIISHIDHGKSTLADRLLEMTHTIDARHMKPQYLDQMELERERGITIKMAPVRMIYRAAKILNPKFEILSKSQIQNSKFQTKNLEFSASNLEFENSEFTLNLIDTPGHSDFSYEVSRALAAVEGAILLVDATQGIQAQTLANFRAAQKSGLKIIGAVNKIDLNPPNLKKIISEVAELIGCLPEEIHLVSGKTGEGVKNLLQAVIEKIPSPDQRANQRTETDPRESALARALIFDSFYDNHKGIIASIRIFNGVFTAPLNARLIGAKTDFKIKELGIFAPELKEKEILSEGEIGYIATGIKDPERVKIGDTVIGNWSASWRMGIGNYQPLAGYAPPKPVVFVSIYPEDTDEYHLLRTSVQKLKLNDSSISTEPDQNEILGRGFRIGFLGRLHFEIVAERLRREFALSLITTFPSVAYRVKTKNGFEIIVSPDKLPNDFQEIWEPMVNIEIMLPIEHLNSLFILQSKFRLETTATETLENRALVKAQMPLAELMSDFDDHLKSISSGFASFNYELAEYKKSDIIKVDILVSGRAIPGLSRLLPRNSFDKEARRMVEKLKELLPQEQYAQILQAQAGGRIIAREDIPALRKDVTGHLYGGDRTRKMKLWQKQKRGKEKLKRRAEAKIPPEVFRELLKK